MKQVAESGRSVAPTRDGYLGGARFPLLVLCTLFLSIVAFLGVLLVPAGNTGLGAFADEFRKWCLQADPVTGRSEWGSLVTMFSAPLMLATLTLAIWWSPLKRAVNEGGVRVWVAPVLTGALLVGGTYTWLAALTVDAQGPNLAFPAESLRTELVPPRFTLTGHDGQAISLESLKGQVVVLTSVYSRCPHTCPLIVAQAKRVLERVPQTLHEDLRFLAITMDPSFDTPEVLASLAEAQGLALPLHGLLTGAPDEVNPLLDRFGFARTRDADTGVIDHANLFIVIDRTGRIAYRFSLGELQEEWLGDALVHLLHERLPTASVEVQS